MARPSRGPNRTNASGDGAIRLEVRFLRPAGSPVRSIVLGPGSTVRDALRSVGQAAEGAAVLIDGRPVPLDEPLSGHRAMVVVPTFSGG